MNLQFITIFLFVGMVFSYKPRKQINQRPLTTTPRKSTKKIDVVPARYKMSRKIHYEPSVVKNLPYFPEVEYPTNIMEVSKPFYFALPKSEGTFKESNALPYPLTSSAPRRESRKTDQDHSNFLKLIAKLKKDGTKTAISDPAPANNSLPANPPIENQVNKTVEINEIPTIEAILESEIIKETEVNASPETEEEDDEIEIELIEYFSDEPGSGDGNLEITEHYCSVDYGNENETSVEEYEYPNIFIIDLLESLQNYDLDIIDEPLLESDEEYPEEILEDVELTNSSVTNGTEEFGIHNWTITFDNETNYVITESEVPTNFDQMTGNFNTPNLIVGTVKTANNNTTGLHNNNVGTITKLRIPKSLLKTRGGRKLQRKRIMNKP